MSTLVHIIDVNADFMPIEPLATNANYVWKKYKAYLSGNAFQHTARRQQLRSGLDISNMNTVEVRTWSSNYIANCLIIFPTKSSKVSDDMLKTTSQIWRICWFRVLLHASRRMFWIWSWHGAEYTLNLTDGNTILISRLLHYPWNGHYYHNHVNKISIIV